MISVGINLSNSYYTYVSDHFLNCEIYVRTKKFVIYDTRVDLVLPERGTVIELYEAGVWGL